MRREDREDNEHHQKEKERIIERNAAGRNGTDADGEWAAYEGEG